MHKPRYKKNAFTRIELLVVIAIIAILAAMLFPTPSRSKEPARMTECINKFRKIGAALQVYRNDHDTRYPPVPKGAWISNRLGGGDPDPTAHNRWGLEWATNRVLWDYTRSRELWHCPSDRGGPISIVSPPPRKSVYDWVGSSYIYNEAPWHQKTLLPTKGRLDGQKENWISSPARYIVIHEPPATPYFEIGWSYTFWHDSRGPALITDLKRRTDRFISPALFADGHAKKHDFTREIESNMQFPSEPTPDWYFYEPAQGTP